MDGLSHSRYNVDIRLGQCARDLLFAWVVVGIKALKHVKEVWLLGLENNIMTHDLCYVQSSLAVCSLCL